MFLGNISNFACNKQTKEEQYGRLNTLILEVASPNSRPNATLNDDWILKISQLLMMTALVCCAPFCCHDQLHNQTPTPGSVDVASDKGLQFSDIHGYVRLQPPSSNPTRAVDFK